MAGLSRGNNPSSMVTLRDILRPGVTGTFGWRGGRVQPIGDAEIKLFKAACHAAARRLHAQATRYEPVAVGTNFYTFGITLPQDGGHIEILLHAVLPYVGVCSPAFDAESTAFVDSPFVRDELCAPLLLLPASLLLSRFTVEPWMETCVDPGAWYDLHYFRPGRVGDFVFNRYD